MAWVDVVCKVGGLMEIVELIFFTKFKHGQSWKKKEIAKSTKITLKATNFFNFLEKFKSSVEKKHFLSMFTFKTILKAIFIFANPG